MEIWLDTTDIELIKHAVKLGLLHGVTTNPSLLAKCQLPCHDMLSLLLDIQDGPITYQVVADSSEEMFQQALRAQNISQRIIIKVPVTVEGIATINRLAGEGIPAMATTVFDASQALLAATAGANYIAPYFGRIQSSGKDPAACIELMMKMINQYHLPTKVLVASLQSANHLLQCLQLGVHAVTLKESLFDSFLALHSGTKEALETFAQDAGSNPRAAIL